LQESITNVIELPNDSPEAMELLILMLYGHFCSKAIEELYPKDGPRSWPIKLLPELYELAIKYQLPRVATCIITQLEDTFCAQSLPERQHFYWDLATCLDNHEEQALEMRPILLRAFRANVDSWSEDAGFVKEQLKGCPKLAAELLMTGDLDGKGMKMG